MYVTLWKKIKIIFTVVNIYQHTSNYLKVTILKEPHIKDIMELSWTEFRLHIFHLSVQKKT